MAAYAHDTSFFSRRALVLLVIVFLHVLLVYALASGLARKVVEVIAPPIETEIVDEVTEREEPPPPPPPELERPPIEVPPPEISIDMPMEPPPTAITNVTDKPQPPRVAPPAPRVVARTAPRVDLRRSPSTDDYYPMSARRDNEEGVVTLRTCVSPQGRAAGRPTVERSSGKKSLDDAAVKWASAARFFPATEDGKPVQSCLNFAVRFRLRSGN